MANQYTKKALTAVIKRGKATPSAREKILKTQGHKDDGEKIKYELIPAGPLHMLAALYTLGAVKYADENWRKGISYKRLFGALMRHAWNWMRGETFDKETGLPHLICAAFCCFSIVELQLQHKRPELDDRFKPALELDMSKFESALDIIKKKKGK